jgi:predicted transcriptional regulator
MRSNQIHRALAQGMNRFEVCRLVSNSLKSTHKPGTRFEESINNSLEVLGNRSPYKESIPSTFTKVIVKTPDRVS